jgi:hypothetical protein
MHRPAQGVTVLQLHTKNLAAASSSVDGKNQNGLLSSGLHPLQHRTNG